MAGQTKKYEKRRNKKEIQKEIDDMVLSDMKMSRRKTLLSKSEIVQNDPIDNDVLDQETIDVQLDGQAGALTKDISSDLASVLNIESDPCDNIKTPDQILEVLRNFEFDTSEKRSEVFQKARQIFDKYDILCFEEISEGLFLTNDENIDFDSTVLKIAIDLYKELFPGEKFEWESNEEFYKKLCKDKKYYKNFFDIVDWLVLAEGESPQEFYGEIF